MIGINMIGKRFGKLEVLKETTSYKTGRSSRKQYICMCDCGTEMVATGSRLRANKTYQCAKCGFLSRKQNKQKYTPLERSYNLHILDRCKKSNILCNLSLYEYGGLISQNCYYCNSAPQFKSYTGIYSNGIDRLDSKLGYSKYNCVPCCTKCNIMKHTLTVKEFHSHILKIIKVLGEDDRYKDNT